MRFIKPIFFLPVFAVSLYAHAADAKLPHLSPEQAAQLLVGTWNAGPTEHLTITRQEFSITLVSRGTATVNGRTFPYQQTFITTIPSSEPELPLRPRLTFIETDFQVLDGSGGTKWYSGNASCSMELIADTKKNTKPRMDGLCKYGNLNTAWQAVKN